MRDFRRKEEGSEKKKQAYSAYVEDFFFGPDKVVTKVSRNKSSIYDRAKYCLPLVFLTFGGLVFAYIPPSEYIVKKSIDKHHEIKQILLTQNIIRYEKENPTGDTFKAITYFDFQGGKFALHAMDSAGRTAFVAGKEDLSKIDSINSKNALLLSPDTQKVFAKLKEIGIPLKTEDELMQLESEEKRRAVEFTSLSRWKKSIFWVIGLPSSPAKLSIPLTVKEESSNLSLSISPQLWILKDAFLLIRLILGSVAVKPTASLPNLELQFDSYRTHGSVLYPHSISWVIQKDGQYQVILKEELVELQIFPKESRLNMEQKFKDLQPLDSFPGALRDFIRFYVETLP